MFPALSQPAIAQWHQSTHRKHKRISVRLFSGLVDEGADAHVVVIMNEVSCNLLDHVSNTLKRLVHEIFLDVV